MAPFGGFISVKNFAGYSYGDIVMAFLLFYLNFVGILVNFCMSTNCSMYSYIWNGKKL